MFCKRESECIESDLSRRTEFEHMLTTANTSLTQIEVGKDTFGSEEDPSEYSIDEQRKHWTSIRNWASSEIQKLDRANNTNTSGFFGTWLSNKNRRNQLSN